MAQQLRDLMNVNVKKPRTCVCAGKWSVSYILMCNFLPKILYFVVETFKCKIWGNAGNVSFERSCKGGHFFLSENYILVIAFSTKYFDSFRTLHFIWKEISLPLHEV